MTTPHSDPADYVGPHEEGEHGLHLHVDAPATDPADYVGPHEAHEEDAEHGGQPRDDGLVVHLEEASADLVHHLEDSMHELEARRRQLTGEDAPASNR